MSPEEIHTLARRAIDAEIGGNHEVVHEVFEELVCHGGPTDGLMFTSGCLAFVLRITLGTINIPSGGWAEAEVARMNLETGEVEQVPLSEAPPAVRCVAEIKSAILNDSDAAAEMAWNDLVIASAANPEELDAVLHLVVSQAAQAVRQARAKLQ